MTGRDLACTGEGEVAERLLVACLKAAGQLSGHESAGLRDVDNWNEAARTMAVQGILPLAGVVMAAGRLPGNVPADLSKAFVRARHRSVLVHRTALDALGEIAPRFGRAGVPWAVVKGPHLQEAYYGGWFPRPYGDIDLLVRPCDVDRALGLLREAGYQPAGSRFEQILMRRVHFHLVLHPASRGGMKIELHWSLVDRANLYRIDDTVVLARAVEWRGGAERFQILSGEDTFLYLCLHSAKHGLMNSFGLGQGLPPAWFCGHRAGNRLVWYVDLDLLLRQDFDRLDWSVVRQRALEWNVMPDIVDTLRVMNLLLPDSAAAALVERFKPDVLRPSTNGWLEKQLQSGEGAGGQDGLMRMSSRFFFRPARLLFLGRLFFPASRELRAYYPVCRCPLFLLQLWHPFHMIRKLFG